MMRRFHVVAAVLFALPFSSIRTLAQNAPGVTDKEVTIGQTMPYSGPASSFSAIGKAMSAYFRKVNKEGGVNGRMINLISVDDGYSPPRALEQTRNLVESQNVFAIVGSFGSPTNAATQKYLNAKKVPSLFLGSGSDRIALPSQYPWSMGWQPSNLLKGQIYAKFILQSKPDAKIAILYQNDDFGKDYVKGFKEQLGQNASRMIVKEVSYEISDTTVDTQLIQLQATEANVLLNIATPKFSAQAIKRVAEMRWNVLHLLSDASASFVSVIQPAGLENSKGVLSVVFRKDPSDPALVDDPGVRAYMAFMKEYMPELNPYETYAVFGVATAQTFVHVLEKCGNDLTRDNLMKQAASIKDLQLPMMLPGLKLNTSPTQFSPIRQIQIVRFDGTRWVTQGDLISAD